jgi:hypothetical protein
MAQGAVAARRPTVVRQATIAAALVVLGTVTGALAGCGKPAQDPTPTSSSTTPSPTATETGPTPSPTPSPTPPAKPATWGSIDAPAAVDAAVYFKDLYNYALETGDLTEWRTLSDPGCGFCTGVAADVDKVYSAGGHYEGGEVTLVETSLVSSSSGIYEVQHTYSSSKSVVVSADGTSHESAEPESGYVVFEVIASQPGWVLLGATARDTPLPAVSDSAP